MNCVRTGTFCMTAIPWADTATERRTVLFTMIGTNMAQIITFTDAISPVSEKRR